MNMNSLNALFLHPSQAYSDVKERLSLLFNNTQKKTIAAVAAIFVTLAYISYHCWNMRAQYLLGQARLSALRKEVYPLQDQKKWVEVIAKCDEILRLDPKDLYALTECGFALAQQKEWEKAVKMGQKALEVKPSLILVQHCTDILERHLNRWDKAAAMYEKYEYLGLDILELWIDNLAHQGKYSLVIEKCEKILTKNPEDYWGLMNCAAAMDKMNQIEPAAEKYKQVLKHYPGDPTATKEYNNFCTAHHRKP